MARLSLGLAAGGGLWRLARASEHERRSVRRALRDARAQTVARLAPHVGGRARAARWIDGGALLLLPLLMHRAVLALGGSAWLVASQVRYLPLFLPRLAAQWAGGLAASAAVWLAWVVCTHGWGSSS